jgi:hypothetical protein
MSNPIERMVTFVREQQQRAAFERACAAWSRKLPEVVPMAQAVVEVFLSGLDEPGEAPTVSVLVEPKHDLAPLVIAFGRRALEEGPETLHEIGASAVFRCDLDGAVYGLRYPFHDVRQDVRPERFADLGLPEAMDAEKLGHAVCDFLEWASLGAGCGLRKVRFGIAPVEKKEELPPLRLAQVA